MFIDIGIHRGGVQRTPLGLCVGLERPRVPRVKRSPYDYETSILGQRSSYESHWLVTPLFEATVEHNTMVQSE